MRVKMIEVMETYLQSNIEQETNPVVIVVWSEGKAIGQKGSLGVRAMELTFNSVRF
jgi:hypothetical protein